MARTPSEIFKSGYKFDRGKKFNDGMWLYLIHSLKELITALINVLTT